jgi:3-hydroxybutyryl-CoA dehydrogenase
MDIQSIGIVGAGQMGNGIAHVTALAGYDVMLTDVSADALQKALETIQGNLSRQVGRGKISESDSNAAMARISTTQTLIDLGQTGHFRRPAATSEADHNPDLEHLVDLDHPSGQPHRPARTLYGLSLHEPRSGDATGRIDPWHRHQRRNL